MLAVAAVAASVVAELATLSLPAASAATLTYSASADARVEEARPTANYATSGLRVDAASDPDVETFVRFSVSGVGGPVLKATLRLFATSGTVDGPAVYPTSSSWSESAITWASRPARAGASTDDRAKISKSAWVAYDVTPLVSGNGAFGFTLGGTSTDGVDFTSREGTNKPQLVLDVGATPDAAPPSAPANLRATAGASGGVALAWTAATDDVGVTGYEISRDGALLASVGPGTSYTDGTAAARTTYSYVVRALDAAGHRSEPSNSATVTTPAAPVTSTLAPAADARVEESSPASNYGTATLRVDGGSDPDAQSLLRFEVPVLSTPVTAASLRLFATSGTVDGPAVSATTSSWPETSVTWTTRPAPQGTPSDDRAGIASGAWVEWNVTPLVSGGGTYSFLLAGTSTDGVDFSSREGANKPQLVVTSAPQSDVTPPSAPSDLAATAATATRVELSWTAASDDTGVTGYRVYRDGAVRAAVGQVTSASDAAAPASTYAYTVTALDAAGNESAPSASASATTPADTAAPSVPSNLTATPVGTRVELRWSASTDDAGIAGYDVYRDADAPVRVGAVTTYSDGSVQPATSYAYRVEAIDVGGNRSGPSDAVAVTTGTADPVLAAAGDIACQTTVPSTSGCHQRATSDLLGDVDAVLTLGDNQYPDGTLAQFQSGYDPTWGRYLAKTYPAPGNHDYHVAGAAGYFDYFGAIAGDRSRGYYSFNLGAWHLIALNSNCDVVGGCGAGSPQYEWLRADLAADGSACTLAYWHHPRFTSGATHTGTTSVDPFWQLLYADHADLVLNGHTHHYERFAPQTPAGVPDAGGVREFIAGTGGNSTTAITSPRSANSEQAFTGVFGVLKLTLHAASYDWRFAPEAGMAASDAGSAACV